MSLRKIYPSKPGQRGLRLFYIEDTETGAVYEPEQCPHDWQPMSSGGQHFAGGEVWDDTRDYLSAPCAVQKSTNFRRMRWMKLKKYLFERM